MNIIDANINESMNRFDVVNKLKQVCWLLYPRLSERSSKVLHAQGPECTLSGDIRLVIQGGRWAQTTLLAS